MKKIAAVFAVCSTVLCAQSYDAKQAAEKQSTEKRLAVRLAGNGQEFGPVGIQTAMAGEPAAVLVMHAFVPAAANAKVFS